MMEDELAFLMVCRYGVCEHSLSLCLKYSHKAFVGMLAIQGAEHILPREAKAELKNSALSLTHEDRICEFSRLEACSRRKKIEHITVHTKSKKLIKV